PLRARSHCPLVPLQGVSLCFSSYSLSPRSSFFFLITRPPPRSTLFPYTTLFRSANSQVGCRSPGSQPRKCRESREQNRSPAAFEDRKSTRLNSSHEWISYAVFCLKKKKKDKKKQQRNNAMQIADNTNTVEQER